MGDIGMIEEVTVYGELSYRAKTRDSYATKFRRFGVLERMALTDFHFLSYTVGRIEIVEEVALGKRQAPQSFVMNAEEEHYAQWLQEVVSGESNGQLLRDQFLYGVPTKMALLVQGTAQEANLQPVQ